MPLKNKKVLVTGADGFIGSHLVEKLLEGNCDVKAFVMYNSFNSWGWLDTFDKSVLKNIEIFAGDVRDPNGVRKAVKGVDIVLHLAALIGIPFSYHSPNSYVDTNINGTLNIMQASRDYDVAKVIVTSTSEVYGTAKYVPIDESHPLQPQSPYSASKIGADHIALSFYNSFNTPVSIIRPFNTYGPRQSARAVIPTIITQLAGEQPLIKLGSLKPTRDFNFVADVVNAYLSFAVSDNSMGEVINIGSNYEISIEETLQMISEIMNVKADIETDPDRVRPAKSEVERLYADNTKAKKILGWEPLYGGRDGLRRGLSETVEWFSDPKNIQGYKTSIYNI